MSLRTVLDHSGPFATVHLDASRDHENADHELELRWRAARRELEGAGASADTVSALEDAVLNGAPPVGRAGRLLVAADGNVLFDQPLPDPPPTLAARFGPLPYLVPLVDREAVHVPYVAALVNKIGADLIAVDAGGVVRTEQAEGQTHPVHKVRAGGWAHLTIQHHTDEVVHRNVRLVIDEVTRLVDEVNAKLLVIGGEDQVLSQLAGELPSRCQGILAQAPGRREAPEEFDKAVAELVRERARAEQGELLDRFHAALKADRGLAAQGLADTTDALRQQNLASPALRHSESRVRAYRVAVSCTSARTKICTKPQLALSERGTRALLGGAVAG
jgi:hypothetical protein